MRAILALLICTSAAVAQEEMLVFGQQALAEMSALRECVKMAVSKATSREEAQSLAKTSCQDVANETRPKVRAVVTRAPISHNFDVEKTVEVMMNMARVAAYHDYTGDLRRYQKNLEERYKR